MNGAVMDHQDSALLPQEKKTSGHHCTEYLLQTHQSRHQNSLHQHSKIMNYQLLSETSIVDGLPELLHSRNTQTVHYTHMLPNGCSQDPRIKISYKVRREPLELPVPKFVIDSNYVTESATFDHLKNTKDLDLDTRIDLLIKSKALAGMHPIFSELNESTSDSNDIFIDEIGSTDKIGFTKNYRSLSPCEKELNAKNVDDSEKPLSRPPSPFLSRATYLFWFNKAIELKQQAKAQEKALLENAAKRLLQENLSPPKINKTDSSCQEENNMIKYILNEASKEFREDVKQLFINEVLETFVINTFENWWEEESQQELNLRKSINLSNKDLKCARKTVNSYMSENNDSCTAGLCSNLNNLTTGKNKDPIKMEQTISHPDFINNITNVKPKRLCHNSPKRSIGTSFCLENTSNPNDTELSSSVNETSDLEFKRSAASDSPFMNVSQYVDNNTPMSTKDNSPTSPKTLSLSDANKQVKQDIEIVRNVLNVIIDEVDEISHQLYNTIAAE